MPPPHPFTVVERYSATAQLLHWTTACPGKHSALDSQSWQLGLVLAPHVRVVRPRRIVGVLATRGNTIHRVKQYRSGCCQSWIDFRSPKTDTRSRRLI